MAPLLHAGGVPRRAWRSVPVGANLFLHYAFDAWMERSFPSVPFERYVDDAVVHCVTQCQAQQVRQALADRLAQVGLRGHPEATRIVYCSSKDRKSVV